MSVRAQFTPITARKVDLIPEAIAVEMIAFANKWADDLVTKMRTYPVWESPRYKRTYWLQGHWKKRETTQSGNLVIFVENNVYYAPYVQGFRQVWYHELHGWLKLQDQVDRVAFKDGLEAIMLREVTNAL